MVVADDGSTDATRNRGKGHALRLGVAATRGRRVLVTDADLATPIEELDRLDKALGKGNSAAIGSRSAPGATIGARQHQLRELLGRAGNVLIRRTALPGPWQLLADKPLFEAVIKSRIAMICAPALGMLLAIAVEQLLTADPARIRYAGLVAVTLALLPLVPAPLKAVDRTAVPAFIADGTWKSYVREGEALVPVPLPDPSDAEALHWQTEAGLGFKLAGGYFNGPYGDERVGIYGAEPRFTSNVLRDVRNSGDVPPVNGSWREQARADLAYWRAGALVLAPQPNDDALRETVEKLVGEPGRWVDGVWVWDLHEGIRPGAAPITLP